jgi:DNA-binding response OmpR family regulator
MTAKLCIIEDDEGIQDILKIILKKAGYQIEMLSHGTTIMEDHYSMPDLFLIDKQLPGPDGLVICKHLKQDETTASIPVVMMSAYPNIAEFSALAGADAFIEKPFRVEDLLSTIKKHVRQPVPVPAANS